jgi:hypothetical protein
MGTRHLYWILAGPTFAVCSSLLKSPLFFLFMHKKFTLDAMELNFFLQYFPLREQRHFHQQLRRRRALIRDVCSSPLKSSFFPFYADEIYAGCDGTGFLFLQCRPLRVQQQFHQQLRRLHALIHYVCSSPFKSLFFPFYAEEIYA